MKIPKIPKIPEQLKNNEMLSKVFEGIFWIWSAFLLLGTIISGIVALHDGRILLALFYFTGLGAVIGLINYHANKADRHNHNY